MLLRKLLAQQWKTFHLHRDYLAKERKERWFSPQRYEFSSLLFILIIDASEFDNPRIRVDREREHTKNFRHSMLLETYLIALETRLLNKLDNFKKSCDHRGFRAQKMSLAAFLGGKGKRKSAHCLPFDSPTREEGKRRNSAKCGMETVCSAFERKTPALPD